MIRLSIDGVAVEAAEGATILEAAAAAGIEIPNLCFMKSLGPYGACGVCVVEVENCPKLMRACATKVAEGMKVNTRGARALAARKLALELLMGDHDADCQGPCRLNCPAHTDVQKYVREIAEGRFADAVATVKETFPLPASIGRVCPHPCERKCRRSLVEAPLAIAALKAFAGERVLRDGNEKAAVPAAPTGKRIAIVGGGPAGLTAAARLARLGHTVNVFDQMPEMGGMLRYGIPAYRLPKAILAGEIAALGRLGVSFVNDFKLGRDATLETLRANNDAVLVACGAWRSMAMGVPGETLPGVWGGIDFLRAVALGERPAIGERVAVVGGGNTAMDACRTAVRLGAKEVSVIYRRTRDEMPAEADEIAEAEEEGVRFRFLRNPVEFVARDGRVAEALLQVMELGERDARGRRSPVPVAGSFETLKLDTVIVAVGQRNDLSGFESLPVTAKGTLVADEGNFATALDGVFACGDAVNRGAGIAIEAIAQANEAARGIDAYVRGGRYEPPARVVAERRLTERDFAQEPRRERVRPTLRPAAERRGDFEAIGPGLSEAEARAEAKRCLECGCHAYDECRLIRTARALRTDVNRLRGEFHPGTVERTLVSIERNSRKCIACNLCVRTCETEAKKGILGLVGRGFATVIRPAVRDAGELDFCRGCHLCADACPTGALRIIG